MALFGMQLQPFEIQYKQMIIFLVEYSITQSITMFGNAHILTALFWSFPTIVIDYGIAEAFL